MSNVQLAWELETVNPHPDDVKEVKCATSLTLKTLTRLKPSLSPWRKQA